MEIPIPGGTAVLRDKLNVGQRRSITLAGIGAASIARRLPDGADGQVDITKVEISSGEAASLFDAQDAMVIAYLESWTLDEPLPTLDTIKSMDGDVYDAILTAATELRGKEGVDTSYSPDRSSPTSGSESSDGGSRAEPTLTPQATQS